jgi:hypothetical protein
MHRDPVLGMRRNPHRHLLLRRALPWREARLISDAALSSLLRAA